MVAGRGSVTSPSSNAIGQHCKGIEQLARAEEEIRALRAPELLVAEGEGS
jgi:hypothetical protein